MPIYSKKCPQKFLPPYTPKYENAGGSKFGVTLRASAFSMKQPPHKPLVSMSNGDIRATLCPNTNYPQLLNDLEILKIVKSHFLQQKNHNFFVKQGMKKMFIPLN